MFDVVVAVLLPFLAWRLLTVRDLFKAVVLFVVFGLLMALVWVRLRAPDVALAEAAIGAGLTGVLFFAALGRIGTLLTVEGRNVQVRVEERCVQPSVETPPTRGFLAQAGLTLFTGALGFTLGWVVLMVPTQSVSLAGLVQTALSHSGVTNPVTAVLLNFRGYDTLLEVAVLLLAVLGVWSLPDMPAQRVLPEARVSGPVLVAFVRLLTPLMIVVGGYLLWVGADAPGGAFQGGAIGSAGGVLLVLSGMLRPSQIPEWPLRAALVMGFALFLTVAVGVLFTGSHLLEYPREWAKALILLIESALTVSIACILVSLFTGRPSARFQRLPDALVTQTKEGMK
jgi:multisubunit Na+/H+ antiporter MnhB subunit